MDTFCVFAWAWVKNEESINQWGTFITTPFISKNQAKVNIKTKVEIDYLYEISKNLQREANSKLQLMAEISFFINNSNSITIGIFQDYLNKTIENRSLSVSYSTSKVINLKI